MCVVVVGARGVRVWFDWYVGVCALLMISFVRMPEKNVIRAEKHCAFLYSDHFQFVSSRNYYYS